MSHRLFPGVFGGSPRHEAHHQQGNVYFHQFFMWIDDALGFTTEGGPKPAPRGRAFPYVPNVERTLEVAGAAAGASVTVADRGDAEVSK